ncbi:hypothetical protein HDV06_000748 [Boothiomyces sp. JEL0866]|nr:hypothetical protein HDV06_000748 [Boothiomyces sp. JEL0866]
MRQEILRLRYSSTFNKYYKTFLPCHAKYFTLGEFLLIIKELNGYQPVGVDRIPGLRRCIILSPLLALFILTLMLPEDPPPAMFFTMAAFILYLYLGSNNHLEYLDIACAMSTSLISSKNLEVCHSGETVIIYKKVESNIAVFTELEKGPNLDSDSITDPLLK